MAANTWTNVIPQLLAQGLETLREQAVMVRLVNTGYSAQAAGKGSTIDIPIPSAVTVRDVSPANVPATNQFSNPSTIAISLDQWKEATFFLTDKEVMEAMSGTIPMQAAEAIKALANQIDSDILALYKDVYNYVGVAGTTPFVSGVTAAKDARAQLNRELAPFGDRHLVLDVDAEANALVTSPFLKADERGDQGGVLQGNIGTKLGMDWVLDQNVPTHTKGTISHTTSVITAGSVVADGTNATITVDRATLTGTLVTGDIFSLSGDSETYVVTATVTASSNAITIAFAPPLKVTAADAVAFTSKATHVANLMFHRDAFAFASRPLVGSASGLGAQIQSAVDPESGIALRLEVSRQHKQTNFSYDILYGVRAVRKELACRIAG